MIGNDPLKDALAHLVAMQSVISSAEKAKVKPSRVWGSDTMFRIMMEDHQRCIDRLRETLGAAENAPLVALEGCSADAEEPGRETLVKLDDPFLPVPQAVMSGPKGSGWSVEAFYGTQEAANRVHTALSFPLDKACEKMRKAGDEVS